MFHAPEKYRLLNHPNPALYSNKSYGNNGAFMIKLGIDRTAFVIASDGEGWEHVSVHVIANNSRKETIPTWNDMCYVKDLFWDDEDCVIQYHPPKSEYINLHKTTLHLWRPTNKNIETPPKILIGFDFK